MQQGQRGNAYGPLKEEHDTVVQYPGYELQGGQVYSQHPTTAPPNYPQHFTSNTTVIAPNTPSIVRIQHVPDDSIGLAIFTTLCCFWPVGIFAILRARDVHKLAYQGDMVGSQAAARSARQLSFIALGIGIGLIVLSILIPVILATVVSAATVSAANTAMEDVNMNINYPHMEHDTTTPYNFWN
ncbi:uncharacterized protein LOC144448453 [Glandiceps talaboti]